MKKLLGVRTWIMIIVLVMSLIAIGPRFNTQGVEITSLDQFSKNQGIQNGEVIKSINGIEVNNPNEFGKILNEASNVIPNKIHIITDKSQADYNVNEDLLFELDNLTIKNSKISGISDGEILKEINNNKIETQEDFEEIRYNLLPSKVVRISTNRNDYSFLAYNKLEINVKEVSKSNINLGLDLEGGTRVLLKPVADSVSDQDVRNLIDVMNNRLNVYGLTDLKIRPASSGNDKLVLIEVAGIPKEEVEDFVAKQGKFEAKIGNETVFNGGREEIPFVCKDDGLCSGIRACSQNGQEYQCRFEFAIKLSPLAAKRHAEVTSKLQIINNGQSSILSEPLDLYLDDEFIDSLTISSSLKGSETTDILISGPGTGLTQEEALNDALVNMQKLQTALITGSLPFELEIVKIDSISPIFGNQFLRNAIISGLVAIISVLAVIYIRYRSFKIIIPMAINLVSEIIIVLGFAGLFGWDLDLASIAGIIASVGTGVDDQIVITDEILRGTKERFFSWKEKLKRAFYIIFVAYASLVVAMLPLVWAVAGLLRGFAFTTIVGVTIGVFITRPAFGAMLERLMSKE